MLVPMRMEIVPPKITLERIMSFPIRVWVLVGVLDAVKGHGH
jgi:hypothetical protein